MLVVRDCALGIDLECEWVYDGVVKTLGVTSEQART